MQEISESDKVEQDLEDDIIPDDTWSVSENEDGEFEARLAIPSSCFAYINGTKAATRKDIESLTNTTIIIPGHKQYGDILVKGTTSAEVHTACNMVKAKVKEKRTKMRATHFVCIPVTTPEVLEAFSKFKEEVLTYPGIDEMLLQTPMKLHLTLGVLTLLDELEEKRASDLIEKFTQTEIKKITKETPIEFKVKGIDTMFGQPEAVNVLYSSVEEKGPKVLEEIGRKMIEKLKATPYATPNQGEVKLHITLMNSKFKRLKMEKQMCQQELKVAKRKRVKYAFDAQKILANHEAFEFGTISAKRIRLSICSEKGQDGAHAWISEHLFVADE